MNKSSTRKLTRFGVILFTGLLLLFAVNQKNISLVESVAINIQTAEGQEALINSEDVLLRIERKFGHRLKKVPFGKLNIEAIENELEKDPFVKVAEVFIDANEKISLNLEQRRPIIRIMGKESNNFLIDDTGSRMPLSPHATPRVTVVTGTVPTYTVNFLKRKIDPFKDLFQLAIELNKDDLLEPLIEQIHIDENNIYSMVPKIGEQKILLGLNENLDSKLERLRVFYQEGLPVEGWNKYKTINLTFDGIVVCKKV